MPADLALRLRAYERVRAAIETLAQLGPVSQVIDHCAVEAAEAADLDRLLLSRVDNGALVVERLHLRAADEDVEGRLEELRRSSPRLAYPLVECELVRRRQARLVHDVDPAQPARFAFLDVMGWPAYVAARRRRARALRGRLRDRVRARRAAQPPAQPATRDAPHRDVGGGGHDRPQRRHDRPRG